MSTTGIRHGLIKVAVVMMASIAGVGPISSAADPPVLTSVFPSGGRAGEAVELTLGGSGVDSIRSLHTNMPLARIEAVGVGKFRMIVPAETMPGMYDLWALGPGGLSSPAVFEVGRRSEIVEPGPAGGEPVSVPLGTTVNGRIAAAGEADTFRFVAKKGQRIVLECRAERIESPLRAVLELFDGNGRRVAANRGYFGKDPLIDWMVPADGVWTVRLHDLTYGGGGDYVYRLDIDTGPRPVRAVPGSFFAGADAEIGIVGRNLAVSGKAAAGIDSKAKLDRAGMRLSSDRIGGDKSPPIRRMVAEAVVDGFALDIEGGDRPVFVGVSDVAVKFADRLGRSTAEAPEIACPGEVEGVFEGDTDWVWFALNAKRGEVFWLEAFGERIGSPVDLRVGISDAVGKTELASFSDVADSPATSLPIGHSDPVGRWVAPADGRFLISVRDVTGGQNKERLRVFRLSLRREEPDFRLVMTPASLNVPAGGRQAFEVVAMRRRGFAGPIRVFAEKLPGGFECPDVWIGPESERAVMVISAGEEREPLFGTLALYGESDGVGRRAVVAAALVRGGSPVARARLVSEPAVAVAGAASLRIDADAYRSVQHHLYGTLSPVHAAGSVVDVAVKVHRRDASVSAPVRLSFEGLPPRIPGRIGEIPEGASEGWISLYLPPTTRPGRFSFVVRAETTVAAGEPGKTADVSVVSPPVTIDVKPAAFLVEADPFTVRKVKRGETFQIRYGSRRRNGFIGKMHTELAVCGIVTDVPGLRGRGETFVGQTDQGTLQVVVNEDAPLGPVRNLRLFTVGVIEDEPVLQGAALLDLEIVE